MKNKRIAGKKNRWKKSKIDWYLHRGAVYQITHSLQKYLLVSMASQFGDNTLSFPPVPLQSEVIKVEVLPSGSYLKGKTCKEYLFTHGCGMHGML